MYVQQYIIFFDLPTDVFAYVQFYFSSHIFLLNNCRPIYTNDKLSLLPDCRPEAIKEKEVYKYKYIHLALQK